MIVTPDEQDAYRLLSDANGLTTLSFSFASVDGDDRQAALGPLVNQIFRSLTKTLSEKTPLSISTVEEIGIQSATTGTDESSLSYVDSIQSATSSFSLLGVGADKLTSIEEDFTNLVVCNI